MTHRTLAGATLLTLMLSGVSFMVAQRADAVPIQPFPVMVDQTGRYATGGMGTARNSLDDIQEISCWNTASGPTLSVSCYAVDKNGNSAFCSFLDNPQRDGLELSSLNFMPDAGSIDFQWDAQGNCTLITLSNYAYLEPKLP